MILYTSGEEATAVTVSQNIKFILLPDLVRYSVVVMVSVRVSVSVIVPSMFEEMLFAQFFQLPECPGYTPPKLVKFQMV